MIAGHTAKTEPPTTFRPPALRKGDVLGVVSPGRWMAEEDLTAAAARLTSLGFVVHLHEQNYRRLHQFAGSDGERAEAINAVIADPSIKGLMFAKGGYGTVRVVDLLDYDLFRKYPKVVVGYSDITALLMSVYSRTGLVTYHGPMLYDLRDGIDADTWRLFENVLVTGAAMTHSFGRSAGVSVVRPGVGVGRLVGGNLTLLVSSVGTATDFQAEGRILFIEEYDEHLYRVDRMLVQLRRSGKLERLAGVIIGRMVKIEDDSIPFGYTVEDMVLQHCRDSAFPIVAGVPVGHGSGQLTLPIGLPVELTATASGDVRLHFLEAPVQGGQNAA